MLGERIRSLRKQKRMTLEALAGDALTKGMLSLIENNKAKPSMESLTYIAERLGVEVSSLLEDISIQELRTVLEQAEKLFNLLSPKKSETNKQIIALIDPYIENLSNGYEAARLLDIYSHCLFKEKKVGWMPYLDRAADIYDQMNLTSNRASLGIFRSTVIFIAHDYQEALRTFLHERSLIEANHAYIDPITRLSLDYHETILYFAVGDAKSALHVMNHAISFSNKNRIYYQIDDLYRMAAGHAMMSKNKEEMAYYATKLKQYGEFADDPNSLLFYKLLMIESLIFEEKQYDEVIKLIDELHTENHLNEVYKPYFMLEKGRALYGMGLYAEALQYLNDIHFPDYMHHPFDLSIFYIADSYIALCHLELKNEHEALKAAKKAIDRFEPLPETSYKDFSMETYQLIKSSLKQIKPADE
ncbi:transcriptional regulator with XRE-family HTH domain [Cytobacillus eiseniae]|uniref:Transcriptional regulator with XRE-family HTH domain n=1 Tax=Cytobacillus eiseniae TaxID=762947 RepID=A0ABS4RIE1_9BACI|nr:helix-turn-helix domain-containing protein [Cytobacillus eiseniae]MBP2242677.1 transcriptional regulator with XRE-family HTH domain [Cytobacillus eiseniae]